MRAAVGARPAVDHRGVAAVGGDRGRARDPDRHVLEVVAARDRHRVRVVGGALGQRAGLPDGDGPGLPVELHVRDLEPREAGVALNARAADSALDGGRRVGGLAVDLDGRFQTRGVVGRRAAAVEARAERLEAGERLALVGDAAGAERSGLDGAAVAGGVQVVAGGEAVVLAARARDLEQRELGDVERRSAVRAKVGRRRARRHGVQAAGASRLLGILAFRGLVQRRVRDREGPVRRDRHVLGTAAEPVQLLAAHADEVDGAAARRGAGDGERPWPRRVEQHVARVGGSGDLRAGDLGLRRRGDADGGEQRDGGGPLTDTHGDVRHAR